VTVWRANQRLEGSIDALATAERDAAAAAAIVAAEPSRAEIEQTANALMAPFNTFLQNVQNETASTFRALLDGGVTTFDDLFKTALDLAKDFAAQMAALLVFNPRMVLGAGGLFGAGGAAPSLASQLNPAAGGTATGPGGLLVGGGVTSSAGAPAASGLASLSTVLGAAALGGIGGGIFGSFLGGQGAIGGSLGGAGGAAAGALIGSVVPGLGTVLGATLGGVLGGAGGGFLGSLFGGGGDDKTKGSFSGAIGRASTSGDSAISSAVKKVDASILSLLDSRQEAIVKQLRLGTTSISVKGGLSSSDLESIASARIGPVAKALGFKTAEILRGDAEQALKNLETAIQTRRSIEDLTGAVSPFERQLEDLENQFQDVEAQAKGFGISTAGLSTALAKATEDLKKAQDAALADLLTPFEQLADPLRAFQTQLEFSLLNPLEAFQRAQADFERIAGLAQVGDLAAIGQLQGAGQLFIDLASRVGASPGAAAATAQVQASNAEVLAKIEDAEREAGADITDAIDRARKEEVTTLRELIDKVDELIRETKRGNKI
jgi:hypothetical protein